MRFCEAVESFPKDTKQEVWRDGEARDHGHEQHDVFSIWSASI
jgi:hypothetical protein